MLRGKLSRMIAEAIKSQRMFLGNLCLEDKLINDFRCCGKLAGTGLLFLIEPMKSKVCCGDVAKLRSAILKKAVT
jgi:hypothetical protein